MHGTHGKKDLLARLELVHAVSVTNRRLQIVGVGTISDWLARRFA